MKREGFMVLLLVLAAAGKRKPRPSSPRAPGGPWWPGDPEDNLGTMPIPEGAHPEEARPPLK